MRRWAGTPGVWLRLPLSVKVFLVGWLLVVMAVATWVMDAHDRASGYYAPYIQEDTIDGN